MPLDQIVEPLATRKGELLREFKIGCGWSSGHARLRDPELLAICQVQWSIIKIARMFLVLSAKLNAILKEVQTCRLKFTRRVSSMFRFTSETQGYSLASNLFDFKAR